MMSALVLFTDEILYISELKDVQIRGKRCSVKYKNNRKYAARVLAVSDSNAILENLRLIVEGSTKFIDTSWFIVNAPNSSFTRVSKKIEVNRDTSGILESQFLFVDKCVIPAKYKRGMEIKSFTSYLEIWDADGFFDEEPEFLQLRLVPSKSDHGKNMYHVKILRPVLSNCDAAGKPHDNPEEAPKDILGKNEPTINGIGTQMHPTCSQMENNDNLMRGSELENDLLLRKNSDAEVPAMSSHANSELNNISEKSPEYSGKNESTINENDTGMQPDSSPMNDNDNVLGTSEPVNDLLQKKLNAETIAMDCGVNTNPDEIPGELPDSLLKENMSIINGIETQMPPTCLQMENNDNLMRESELENDMLLREKLDAEVLAINSELDDIPEESPEYLEKNESTTNANNAGMPPKSSQMNENDNCEESSDLEDELSLSKSRSANISPVHFCDDNCEIDGIPDFLLKKNVTFNENDIEKENNNNYVNYSEIQDNLLLRPEWPKQNETYVINLNSATDDLVNDKSHDVAQMSDGGHSELQKTSLVESNSLNNASIEGTIIAETIFDSSESNNYEIDPLRNNINILEEDLLIDQEVILNNVDIDHKTEENVRKNVPKVISNDEFTLLNYKDLLVSGQLFIDGNFNLMHHNLNDTSDLGSPMLQSSINESQGRFTTDVDEQEIQVSPTSYNRPQGENQSDEDEDYEPNDDVDDSEDSDMKDDNEDVKQETVSKLSEDAGTKAVKRLNVTLEEDLQGSAPDDRELQVDPSSCKTKKHFCLFCRRFQSKLARHLENVHGDEEEVKKFSSLPPRCKERQGIIAVLRKQGDHLHNTDRKLNNGTLLVCRRPNARMSKTGENFQVCGNCRGQYSKKVIRHHWRKCTNLNGKKERFILVKGKKIAKRVHVRASEDVRKYIFAYLREDEIVRGIRYDELAILYANKQCSKYFAHEHLHEMIRARMRLLGRFLQAVKKVDDRISNLADVFQPKFYDASIAAVRTVAGFIAEQRTFEHPAVAANLGTLLKVLGEILCTECIKNETDDIQRKVENFLKLLKEDFAVSINRVVTETQAQHNRRKTVVLPSTGDVKKLYAYVINLRDGYFSQLSKEFSFDSWKKLAQAILVFLEIFNRRRPGETERLHLEDFLKYKNIDYTTDRDSYNALSAEGKEYADSYIRLEIRGKLGRGVPVLVDKSTVEALNLVVKFRMQAGVPERNLYLFGLPSNDPDRSRYLRACQLIRRYSIDCGAENPTTLRATELRKHVATRCINLNLTNGQTEDLAKFMGHDPKIHIGIYRQAVLTTDIVHMAKLLNMVQNCGDTDHGPRRDQELAPDTSSGSLFNEASTSGESTFNEPGTSREGGSSRNFNKKPEKFSRAPIFEPSVPKRWTEVEKATVMSAYQKFLENGQMPSGKDMQEFIESNSCLRGRTVPQLRTWLHTQKKKVVNA